MNIFEFEDFMKRTIIDSYCLVYGEDKWMNLSDQERNLVLHYTLNDLVKFMEEIENEICL